MCVDAHTSLSVQIQLRFNEALLDLMWLQNPHEITHKSAVNHLKMLAIKYKVIMSGREQSADIQYAVMREITLILLDCNTQLTQIAQATLT